MNRGRFQGVAAIVRFNWPFYVASCLVIVAGLVLGIYLSGWLAAMVLTGTALALWLTFASLLASWWVYDVSDLHRYHWLTRAAGRSTGRWINAHSGFDETTLALKERLPGEWIVLDHFDPVCMSEPSIHRAKKLYPPLPGTLAAPFDRWPVAHEAINGIFGLLAIHELRTHADRVKWFAEARRVLAPGGRVILVEHVRDAANFIVFGPGFLHFHSIRTWEKSWQEAGFRSKESFRISPWVRVFILTAR
jgi:SAM-dependent methyltransferase